MTHEHHLTATDALGPIGTTGGGVIAATASLSAIQWIGLIASVVGIIWGTINIIRALYFFSVWINSTAIPWYRERKLKKSSKK